METVENMLVEQSKSNKKLLVFWFLLIAAMAGTFFLRHRLENGQNAAAGFLSGNSTKNIYLYEDRAEPTNITVRKGEEVIFVVIDGSTHNMAEVRSSRSRGARLESGEFTSGESYSLSFSKDGMYSFYDRMNTDIEVTITVK